MSNKGLSSVMSVPKRRVPCRVYNTHLNATSCIGSFEFDEYSSGEPGVFRVLFADSWQKRKILLSHRVCFDKSAEIVG